MASFNSLVTILSQKLMDGSNYNKWKINPFIVLEYENIKFVLPTLKPTVNASDQVKKDYSDWHKANNTARCYIHASIANHLKPQISKLESEVEMIQSLDGMFANSSFSARQSAMRDLMYTRMTGGSVRDHCLKMMSHLSQAEVMGTKLEQKCQIDIILESLLERFN